MENKKRDDMQNNGCISDCIKEMYTLLETYGLSEITAIYKEDEHTLTVSVNTDEDYKNV